MSSDLQRARRTAELLTAPMGLPGPVGVDPDLREYDVGEWSGLSRAEIERRWPGGIDDWRHNRLAATPGGESRQAFLVRILAAVTRVGADHPPGPVLVITHGGVISALARSLGADPAGPGHLGGRWVDTTGEGLRLGVAVAVPPAVDDARGGRRRPGPGGGGRRGWPGRRAAVTLRQPGERAADDARPAPACGPGPGTCPFSQPSLRPATFRTVKVEVVRSPRRRKTVAAQEVNGVLRVSIPASMTKADEERWVAEMVRRLRLRTTSVEVDLDRRAEQLADRYLLPHPASIRWVDNQAGRWGSCTPADGAIRISSRVARGAGLGARLRDRARAGPSGRAQPRCRISGRSSIVTPRPSGPGAS